MVLARSSLYTIFGIMIRANWIYLFSLDLEDSTQNIWGDFNSSSNRPASAHSTGRRNAAALRHTPVAAGKSLSVNVPTNPR
jgi:hypothetical protein